MQLNVKNSVPMKYKMYKNYTTNTTKSHFTFSYSYTIALKREETHGFIYQHFHALPPPFRPHSVWALLLSPSPLAFFTNMYLHGTHSPGCGPPLGPLRNLFHPIGGECHHVFMVAIFTTQEHPPKMRPFLIVSYKGYHIT